MAAFLFIGKLSCIAKLVFAFLSSLTYLPGGLPSELGYRAASFAVLNKKKLKLIKASSQGYIRLD